MNLLKSTRLGVKESEEPETNSLNTLLSTIVGDREFRIAIFAKLRNSHPNGETLGTILLFLTAEFLIAKIRKPGFHAVLPGADSVLNSIHVSTSFPIESRGTYCGLIHAVIGFAPFTSSDGAPNLRVNILRNETNVTVGVAHVDSRGVQAAKAQFFIINGRVVDHD